MCVCVCVKATCQPHLMLCLFCVVLWDEGSHWPGTWRCARLAGQGTLLHFLGFVVTRWQAPEHHTWICLKENKKVWGENMLQSQSLTEQSPSYLYYGLEVKLWTKDYHLKLLPTLCRCCYYLYQKQKQKFESKSWNFKGWPLERPQFNLASMGFIWFIKPVLSHFTGKNPRVLLTATSK